MLHKVFLSMVASVFLLDMTGTQACAQVQTKHFSDGFQKRAMWSTVRITATNGEKRWQGSSVCIKYFPDTGNAVILTASHVIDDAKQMTFEVFTPNSFPNPARVYKRPIWKTYWSKTDDVGIIVAKIWVPYSMPLAPRDDLTEDDPLLSIGCGHGAPPGVQVARYLGLHESGYYEVDGGSYFGRSGGRLISRQGVIGICSQGGNDLTLYVAFDKIQDFFRSLSEEVEP